MRYQTSPCKHLINTLKYNKLAYIRTILNFINKYSPITSWSDHNLSILAIRNQWRHNDVAPLLDLRPEPDTVPSPVSCSPSSLSLSIYWFPSMSICLAPAARAPPSHIHHSAAHPLLLVPLHLTFIVILQNDMKHLKTE
jgi:hypothetical protein